MAKWNKGKADPSKINGGKEFTTDDVLTLKELNSMVNNSFYAVDFAEANTLSIGSVSSGDSASATITGTAPNRFLNLVLPKGEKGDKGDAGDSGNLDTSLSATSTNGVQNKVISAKITEIEDRLTSLGFKEGVVSLDSRLSTPMINTLKKQGNYCFLKLGLYNLSLTLTSAEVSSQTVVLGTVPAEFRPKEVIYFYMIFYNGSYTYGGGNSVTINSIPILTSINTSGQITINFKSRSIFNQPVNAISTRYFFAGDGDLAFSANGTSSICYEANV